MKTVQICKDVTATLSDEKFKQYIIAWNATEERKDFSRTSHSDMDWSDYIYYLDILWCEENEAWERFCS